MATRHTFAPTLLLCTAAAFACCSLNAYGEPNPPAASPTTTARDGRHDFDWDIGTWKTHQRRLMHPLTGSTTWVEYYGTDVVRKVWDGANVAHILADGSGGHLELFALRLYNPDTHEWSIHFSNPGSGTLSTPVVGSFKNKRADFIDQESYDGKTILVRFSVFDITPDSCQFEQAFSPDGGKTWETNFVVSETLMKDQHDSQH